MPGTTGACERWVGAQRSGAGGLGRCRAGRRAGGATTHHLALQEGQQVLPGPLWPEGQADDAHPRDSLELPLRLTRVELRAKEIEGQVRPGNKRWWREAANHAGTWVPPEAWVQGGFRGGASASDTNTI